MANPIIKIKRGSGEPPIWNGINGITAGEFAFDRNTGMLYLGVTGQYLEENFLGLCALNGPFVIPIGAQISNDEFFGSGGDEGNLGYSEYTIPTTKAVRDYVLTQKAAAAFGFTLEAGNGISLTEEEQNILLISNTGALEGFNRTQLQAQNGGVVIGNGSAIQLGAGITNGILKFLPQSGIAMSHSASSNTFSIGVHNIGVTGINGATGNITSFNSVGSLSGSTAFINNIANQSYLLLGSSPINVVKILDLNAENGLTQAVFTVSHTNILEQVPTGNEDFYGGFRNGTFYVPAITMDSFGHVQRISEVALFGDGAIPAGLTEAVQDIVGAPGFLVGNSIGFLYSDSNNRLTVTNQGVTSLNGLTGPLNFAAGSGSNLTITPSGRTITIDHNIPYFKNINVQNLGNAVATLDADAREDTLVVNSGSGIALTANAGDDTFTITNSGVTEINGATGSITLAAGTNVTIERADKTITINAAGGGGGSIGSINSTYTLDQQNSGQGVTGFIKIEGLSYDNTNQAQAFPALGNIISYVGATTVNGQILLDLTHDVRIPRSNSNNSATITIPPSAANGIRTGNSFFDRLAVDTTWSDNALLTPAIRAGTTGPTVLNGDGTDASGTISGKELVLHAEAGSVNGLSNQGSGTDAAILLSGYPSNQNIGNILQEWIPAACPDNVCVGFPPLLPQCDGVNSDASTSVVRGTISLIGNVAVDGGLVVKDDIFLKGYIFGPNGCKYDIGSASQASNYFDECGTLRNPGGIYLNGSTCDADANRAIFNVDEFFIKDRLVTIGGASGNNAPLNNGLFGTTMDVGFLMPSFLGGQARTAFIGIDTSDGPEGTFKFIPTASLTEDTTGRFVGGAVGPAKFLNINGITFDPGQTVATGVKFSNSSSNSNSGNRVRIGSGTNVNVTLKGNGHITFTPTVGDANSGNITLDSAAHIGVVQNGKLVQGIGGTVEFASGLQGLTFNASSDQLTIIKRTNAQTGTYLFPAVTNGASVVVDTTSTQTLTDKTIGEDCVIDCGSY